MRTKPNPRRHNTRRSSIIGSFCDNFLQLLLSEIVGNATMHANKMRTSPDFKIKEVSINLTKVEPQAANIGPARSSNPATTTSPQSGRRIYTEEELDKHRKEFAELRRRIRENPANIPPNLGAGIFKLDEHGKPIYDIARGYRMMNPDEANNRDSMQDKKWFLHDEKFVLKMHRERKNFPSEMTAVTIGLIKSCDWLYKIVQALESQTLSRWAFILLSQHSS